MVEPVPKRKRSVSNKGAKAKKAPVQAAVVGKKKKGPAVKGKKGKKGSGWDE